ncbi:Holo-[acyl-carrier-protein] synthase [hydrothermal vent metagenome]|uniref:Holo-[acyl-carrier-protein] synthase n=1 Tax=hydrothermal vent metagenome TaxID=652676 RepID=A0A3B1ATJ9_9ZZZZ
MIYGIGTDIVSVERMRNNIERHGKRFAERILSDEELQDFAEVVNHAHFLAKRFAAKEAVAKAMGTGFIDGLSLREISVSHDGLGKPILKFTGKAEEFILREGIHSSYISLADEVDYAVAFVTLGL